MIDLWDWAEDKNILVKRKDMGSLSIDIRCEYSSLIRSIGSLTGIHYNDDMSGTIKCLYMILEEERGIRDSVLEVYKDVPLYLGKLNTHREWMQKLKGKN